MKKELLIVIGELIQSKRKSLNIRQEDLAKALNITRTSLSNIEAGLHGTSIYTYYLIASALDCNIYNILPNKEHEAVKSIQTKIVQLTEEEKLEKKISALSVKLEILKAKESKSRIKNF